MHVQSAQFLNVYILGTRKNTSCLCFLQKTVLISLCDSVEKIETNGDGDMAWNNVGVLAKNFLREVSYMAYMTYNG